jgi:MFS family permease
VSQANAERRTMRQNLRDLPGAAWILIAGTFINWFASFAITFLVLYLTKQGFGFAKAGSAVAAYGLGELVAGAVGGDLADRIGRRTTIVLATFASAATIFPLYFVRAYWGILVMAFLAGVATESWRPASRALMADLVPEGRRVTAFAAVRLAGNLGLAVGSALAGFLANRSFFLVFAMDAGTSVLFGLVALVSLPETKPKQEPDAERVKVGYRVILSDHPYLIFLAASALIAFVYYQGVGASLPLHVVRVSHLRPSDFGLLLALNGVLVASMELPISALTMRRSARSMIALGFLLVAVGFGLTAVARSLPLLIVTVVIWTFGEMVAAPVGYAYVADIAPAHLRGRYQGLYGMAWGTASVTGPAVGTVLLTVSVTGFWALCGVLGAVAAGLALLGREPKATEAATPVLAGPGPEPTDVTVEP